MTLDPETKARIEAEEAYRRELRSGGRDVSLMWGLAGCALLAAGTMLPAVNVPLLGSINLLGTGDRDGVILVALAVLGAVLLCWNRPWVLFSAALAGAFLVYKFNDLRELGGDALGVELGLGWLVMAAGVGLMAWAGFKLPRQ